jgi:hypothetical protein
MPAGTDFICRNKDCEHHDKGFSITAPWPIGDIDKIIDAPNVAKYDDFRKGLLNLKADGRKYACITYPNINEIETVGYRVHKWCPSCPCLWTYDAIIEDGDEDIEQTIQNADIPGKCPKCDTEMMDFTTIIEDGIKCPFCKEEMEKSSWFTNETTEEIG